MVSPQHMQAPSQTPEHPLPQKWRDLCQPTSNLPTSLSALPWAPTPAPITHLGTTVRAGSWAPPFIAAVKVSGGELCQQSPRVTAPPAWPQDTKGKFPFISTSSAPGLFLPPIVKGSQRRRETLAPLRDWEVEIQTDRGRDKAGRDLERLRCWGRETKSQRV